jgi:hypothetical protein
MKTNFLAALLLTCSCSIASLSQASANKTDAKLLHMPAFELSSEAKAAGLDGKLVVDLTVGVDGKASKFKVYGTPMWPCGKDPKDSVIENVRDAVKQHLLSAKFEPATKDRKPKSSDVQITFLLSETLRKANDHQRIQENLRNGIIPELVDLKDIQRYAITLPKQVMASRNSPSYRLTEMQILVDENGDVVSAGGLRAGQMELREARELLCAAKFKPLVLNQKPVKMAGTVMYGLY